MSRYYLKYIFSKYLNRLFNLFGYCGHLDTCRQNKFRDSCTRYEVPHIENDLNRLIYYEDSDDV